MTLVGDRALKLQASSLKLNLKSQLLHKHFARSGGPGREGWPAVSGTIFEEYPSEYRALAYDYIGHQVYLLFSSIPAFLSHSRPSKPSAYPSNQRHEYEAASNIHLNFPITFGRGSPFCLDLFVSGPSPDSSA
jgi:hypothetical protein